MMKATLVLAFALGLLSTTLADQVVYKNDFQRQVGGEWSKATVDTTPTGGRRFLGQFGNETVTLSLSGLSAHDTVAVSLDLLIMDSWDGNQPTVGPDIWDLGVQGGAILLHTSFANFDTAGFRQAYPDTYPGGDHLARTGAAENNTLGYPMGGDSVYHLRFTFPHSAKSLVLKFTGDCATGPGLTAKTDESWGLDNIEVRTMSVETEAKAHYMAGEKAYQAGDYHTAISEWEQVLKLKPTSEGTKRMLTKARQALPEHRPTSGSTAGNPAKDEYSAALRAALDTIASHQTSPSSSSGLAKIEPTAGPPVATTAKDAGSLAPGVGNLVLDTDGRAVAAVGDAVTIMGQIKDYTVKSILLKADGLVVDKKDGDGNYALEWRTDKAFVGEHLLKVIAVRGTGTQEVKKLWTRVTDKRPLLVTSPAPNAELLEPTRVEVALSSSFELAKVMVYANGKPMQMLPGSDLVWNVPATPPGNYMVEARATAGDGAVLVSPPIAVTIPARVSLTSPPPRSRITITDNATTISLTAAVHPKIQAATVQFMCDGKLVAECVPLSFSALWDGSELRGAHSLTALLTDTKGHTYESTPCSIITENVPLNRKLKDEADKRAAKAAEEAAKEQDYSKLVVEVTKLIRGETEIVGPWNCFLTLKNYSDHTIRADYSLILHFDDYSELRLFRTRHLQSDEWLYDDIVLPAQKMITMRFREGLLSTGSRSGARPIYITYCGGRLPLPPP